MKPYISKLFLFISLLCLVSCQSNKVEDIGVIDNGSDVASKTYTMYFDAQYPFFADDEAECTTRATNGRWENGDVLYLHFNNGNTPRIGEGVYNSSTGKWTIKLDNGSLSNFSGYNCKVYYLRGGSASRTANEISLDELTAVFADEAATYTVCENEVYLSASLKPQTWRMAFKGVVNNVITILPTSSINYINKINLSNGGGLQYTGVSNRELKVQGSGKTPYIHGLFDNNSSQSASLSLLVSRYPNLQFTRSISSTSLHLGESGIVTLPTSKNSTDTWTSKPIEALEHRVVLTIWSDHIFKLIEHVCSDGEYFREELACEGRKAISNWNDSIEWGIMGYAYKESSHICSDGTISSLILRAPEMTDTIRVHASLTIDPEKTNFEAEIDDVRIFWGTTDTATPPSMEYAVPYRELNDIDFIYVQYHLKGKKDGVEISMDGYNDKVFYLKKAPLHDWDIVEIETFGPDKEI